MMVERVWEKYLTDQDKEHLAAAGHRLKGFGERPALLMVDLYIAGCSKTGCFR
jgi:hypothetical protein